MRCRNHHNWDVVSPQPLSRLWPRRHLDQFESRLAEEGIWTRSRGLWLVEGTAGQCMQLHPTDVVRIREADRSLMYIRKLCSTQFCGVHDSRHRRRYLWLQPLSPWERGESEQSEYTKSNGMHETLNCQSDLRIWPWRRLLDTIRNVIFKQCEEKAWARIEFRKWLDEDVLLINGVPLSARMGSTLPIWMLLSPSFQTRIGIVEFQARCGNCNPLLSKVERNKSERVRGRQAQSNHLTVSSRSNCSSAFEEDPGPHSLWLNAIVHQVEGKVVNRPFGWHDARKGFNSLNFSLIWWDSAIKAAAMLMIILLFLLCKIFRVLKKNREGF